MQYKFKDNMGAIFILEGLLIYIYAYDQNPPHIHVRGGSDYFTITIHDRVVTGRAKARSVMKINEFLDSHLDEIMALWDRAQRGETIKKINR